MKKILLSLMILVFSLMAEQQTKSDSLKYYVEILQNRINDLESEMIESNSIYDASLQTYSISQRYMESADSLNERFLWIITIIISFATAILISALGFMYKNLKHYFENKLESDIADITSQSKNTIIDLSKKHIKEKALLDDSKMLIINKVNTPIENNFQMILRRFNKTPKTEEIVDFESYNYSGNYSEYDVVIFENSDGEWNFNGEQILSDKLVEIAKLICESGTAFYFIGNNDGRFSEKISKEFKYLINYSSTPATIFSNLIDLLDLRRLLQNF